MRLIDADALIQEIDAQCPDYKSNSVGCIAKTTLNDCKRIVKKQPTIKAAPVVQGKWENDEGYDEWKCSECGQDICGYDDNPIEYGVRYCFSCGARMDEKAVDE